MNKSKIITPLLLLMVSMIYAQQDSIEKKPIVSDQENCRLMVQFYSIGSGTNYKAIKRLDSLMTVNKLNAEIAGWGWEGETDYCFYFKDLNKKQQKKIICKIKKLLKKEEYIHFYENQPPQHKPVKNQ